MKKRNKKEDNLIRISAGILIVIIAMSGVYIKILNAPEKEIIKGRIGELYSEEGELLTGAGNQVPSVGKVVPEVIDAYYNNEVKFATKYSDGDGINDLIYGRIIVDNNISLTPNRILIDYYPDLNIISVYNESNNPQSLGDCILGERKVIENSNVQVDCLNTNKIISGNNLTMNWVLSFKNTFVGNSFIYPYAKDRNTPENHRTWIEGGNLSLSAYGQNNGPVLGQFIPVSGESYVNQEVNFIYSFSDLDGVPDLVYGALMINTNDTNWPSSPVWVHYYPDYNLLEIVNESDNTITVGNCTPGENKIIENRNAKINCSKLIVWKFATNLTIDLSLAFKEAAVGKNYSIYPYAKDRASPNHRVYENKANWSIKAIPPNVAPNPESISIGASGIIYSKRKLNFGLLYSDSNGGNDIIYGGFIIDKNISAANKKVWLDYNILTNFIELKDDKNNSVIIGNCTAGTNTILSNSYVELYCSESSKSVSGNNLNINLNILLKDNLTGNWTMFMKANDTNLTSDWKEIVNISIKEWNLTCNDSDNGLDYYEAGTAEGINGEFMDYCINSSSLKEYYCNDSTKEVISKSYKCPRKCSSRKCVDITTTVTTPSTTNVTTQTSPDRTETYTPTSLETTEVGKTPVQEKTVGEIVVWAIVWTVVVLFIIVFIYFIYSLNKKRALRKKVLNKPLSPVIRQMPPGYYRPPFRR